MEQRKWEDLDKDCLVKVFEKVDMESLLLDVPFVCKSWHKETLNPCCWKRLIFPDYEPEFPYLTEQDCPIYHRSVSEFRLDKNRFSVTSFIKSVVNLSQGKAVFLKLPGCSSLEAFEYVANECPEVMFFGLPRSLLWRDEIDLELLGNFKNLFMLTLGCCTFLDRALAAVSKHCKLFSHLILCNAHVGKQEATSIVNSIPHIKALTINGAHVDRDGLVILLKGCKELVMLDARNCIGFKESDEEIAKLASHIEDFRCEGAKDSREQNEYTSRLSRFSASLTEDMAQVLFGRFNGFDFPEIDGEAEADEGEGESDDEEEP